MDSYLSNMDEDNAVVPEAATLEPATGLKRKLSTVSKPPRAAAADPASVPASEAESPCLKRRKSSRNSTSGTDSQNDCYCWICHKEGDVICCKTCPRVFHLKCIQLETPPTEEWVCPECVLIMTAENMDTRSRAMRLLTVDQLCVLLRHALLRMRSVSGVEPFLKPVDLTAFPAYKDYVFCPMDLSTIEKNIKKKQYGSTEAFLADVKWILHNCIIFNSLASKLTANAKSLIKVCKHEMQEIENCPDCYLNAHTRKDSWFVAACRIPHLLVWAKLKGFPFWPAKAMRINSEDNVDVRFFGAHDRAWIPVKDVYLYSKEPPVVLKNKKKGNLEGCIHEVENYTKNIAEKFGKFEFAPFKTSFDPKKEEEQIKMLYPNCTLPFELGSRRRARTFSFSGSERSHTNTPTPSEDVEADAASEAMDATTDIIESQEEVEEELEQPPPMPEKGDLEDELLTTEDEEKSLPKTTVVVETTEVVKAVKAVNDRAAASPPCEVSSTTLENAKAKSNASSVTTEVIAETSETVVLEGAGPDEEEIDDVEPDADEKAKLAAKAKISDEAVVSEAVKEAEPDRKAPEAEVEKVAESVKEVAKAAEEEKPEATEEKMEVDEAIPEQPPPPAKAVQIEKPVEEEEEEEEEEDTSKAAAAVSSGEEEIDDEEPELVISEEVEKSRLEAAGVSVTVVEKAKKPDPEIGGLSSDISVTVVHKKKIEVGAGSGPKISVKKESELLQDPAKKDVVEVTTRPKQNRRPSIEVESSGKAPPDPIVTISKVGASNAAAPGASLLRNPPAPKTSSPALSKTSTASNSLNSLASILGQPRMSTSHPNPPRFGAGSRSANLPPPLPRNNSPLMYNRPPVSMMSGPMGMPNLHPRPPTGVLGALHPVAPSGAGPVSEQLNKVAGKLVDFMRGTLEELFKELSSQGSPEATIKVLQIEMEKMQWRHQQELSEVKHNADLLILEIRQSMEAERQKMMSDYKKQAEIEKHKAIAETKKKQWCAHCGKEAIFYCCWNTSYCDYPCQQAHWPTHMSTCAQNQSNQDEDGSGDQSESSSASAAAAAAEAVGHFLATSSASSVSRSNGLSASRGMQGNPLMMPPFGHQGGLNPRMMNQLNMRMAAAAAAASQPQLGPRGPLGGQIRFPGSFYM